MDPTLIDLLCVAGHRCVIQNNFGAGCACCQDALLSFIPISATGPLGRPKVASPCSLPSSSVKLAWKTSLHSRQSSSSSGWMKPNWSGRALELDKSRWQSKPLIQRIRPPPSRPESVRNNAICGEARDALPFAIVRLKQTPSSRSNFPSLAWSNAA